MRGGNGDQRERPQFSSILLKSANSTIRRKKQSTPAETFLERFSRENCKMADLATLEAQLTALQAQKAADDSNLNQVKN